MNRLNPDSRKKLLLVAIGTVAVLVVLYLTLITSQQNSLIVLNSRQAAAQKELNQVTQTLSKARMVETELTQASGKLADLEKTMASGDIYSWAITTIRDFKSNYKTIEIPQYSQIDGPRELELLPNFPYKQAKLTIAGTAPFADFGKFVADFENQFPYMQLLNLSLEPVTTQSPAEPERLSFKVDVVMLVKPHKA